MPAAHPSLDGRAFAADAEVAGGDVGPATVFRYREADGVIWASYAGGEVVRGELVGTRAGDELRFRYVQVRRDGSTASGRCTSTVTALPDGRLAMDEVWAWESAPGSGTSRVVELRPAPAPPGAGPIGQVRGPTIALDAARFGPGALAGLEGFAHVEVVTAERASVCRLVAVRGLEADVQGLGAADGTPVLDLRPVLPGLLGERGS